MSIDAHAEVADLSLARAYARDLAEYRREGLVTSF